MRTAKLYQLAFSAFAIVSAALLSSCETTSGSRTARVLPPYEPPLARSDLQTVRTTAYTHSEADHLEYGARNALGGRLQAASIPRGRIESVRRATRVSAAEQSDNFIFATTIRATKSASAKKGAKGKAAKSTKAKPLQIGSAAADWSRWPIGTTFRILSTGQTYKVDDYGWALAGRNTIDLYMGSRSDMNSWGVRHEPIEILRWGDVRESIRVLEARQSYKHCRRMLLGLRGLDAEAAALN